ncbi:MAG: GNAT family N-acetyltransferase [Oscillospiraceae bacterium]|nr:GNAT family N-acetyltransferase [Oscillospiraceae bacterium]
MNDIKVFDTGKKLSKELFLQYYQLIEMSFPKCEHWSFAKHLEEFEDIRFHSLCYCPDGIKGFINYWELDGFVYIEHFAVTPELRGQGIGAGLMSELRHIVGEQCLVLEAEPPSDSAIAARRIAFYQRLGFALNDFDYLQPAMSDGESEVPLVIMSSPKTLSEAEYNVVRDVLYREIYKKTVK